MATLAIFQAIDVDPILNMLVFGESILNDAVAIVLTTTVLESGMSCCAILDLKPILKCIRMDKSLIYSDTISF